MSAACMRFGVALPRHYSPADAYLAAVPAALRRLAEHVEVAQLRAAVVAPYVALVQKGALLGNAARLLRTRAKYGLLDAAGTAALAALGHQVPSFRTTCRWMDAYLCNGLPGLLPPGYPIQACHARSALAQPTATAPETPNDL